MLESRARAVGPLAALVVPLAAGLTFAAWTLAGDGARTLGIQPGTVLHRVLVLGCLALLAGRAAAAACRGPRAPRTVAAGLAVGIPGAVALAAAAVLAVGVTAHLPYFDLAALELYGAGTYLAVASRWQRARWARRPDHANELYVQGWFRWARHIDLLGDLLAAIGGALLVRRVLALAIPVVWLDVVVSVAIPRSDALRRAIFGATAADYEKRVAALVPWIF